MKNDINNILNKAKELLKGEMTEIAFNTWILPLEIDRIDDSNIVLVSNDSFQKDQLESRYHDLVVNTFNLILQKKCTFTIVSEKQSEEPAAPMQTINHQFPASSLNPQYSFGSFVVGDNNRFAHAASLAVSEAPGTAYNPLFLYGGVGLGKTHLLHAIGNEMIRNNKNLKVLYVDSEKLLNEFINSLKDATIEKFRQKYRNMDVLLIDDIQFIAGKDRLQEEFFHTFNTLRESGRQIVLSSDRPPRDIPLLEDRLKSRFEWGLLADVSMADYETRLAILRKKSDEKNIIVDDDILANIAAKIDSNIRELEGIFNKLVAKTALTHTPITMEMSEKAINDIILQKASIISVDYIQEIICSFFDVSKQTLTSSHRSNDVAFPRQIGMYLSRILTNASFNQIGDAFGKRDHSTVMHAFRKIEKEMKENPETKLMVDSVKKLILNEK